MLQSGLDVRPLKIKRGVYDFLGGTSFRPEADRSIHRYGSVLDPGLASHSDWVHREAVDLLHGEERK